MENRRTARFNLDVSGLLDVVFWRPIKGDRSAERFDPIAVGRIQSGEKRGLKFAAYNLLKMIVATIKPTVPDFPSSPV